jgi:EXS family
LINAGKYFSDLLVPLAALWYTHYVYNTAFWIWFSIHMVASSYSYAWDIIMDWGLLRSKEEGTYALRPKINYHPYFYYYAMVSDFILRFFWIVTIFPLGSPTSPFNTFQMMTMITILAECFRRA